MKRQYNLQRIELSKDWLIIKHEFYDIAPNDEISEEDKFLNLYCREDLLLLQNREYHLDLGWYGSDKLDISTTGYMLVLFRGESWNNCELLELIRTQSKNLIVESINEILKAETEGFYEDKSGYRIDENDEEYRFIGQHYRYSVKNNLNELVK